MAEQVLSQPDLRARLGALIENKRSENAILALILLNAAILGLETWPVAMAQYGSVLHLVDQMLLGVFVLELLLRVFVYGRTFFKDPWRIFDTVVVAIALVPSAGPFAVLRALRVLRVLRVITVVPSMRRVVAGLLGALPGLGSILSIMVIIFYVGAVIATKLFGADFPEWFGSIAKSSYTLFQVMTLESWSMGIVRPVMERFPYAWAFFVPYILVATFTMLNLFIAVIVNAMQSESQAERDKAETDARDNRADILAELKALRTEVAALRRDR